jgi:hypothetical protein
MRGKFAGANGARPVSNGMGSNPAEGMKTIVDGHNRSS